MSVKIVTTKYSKHTKLSLTDKTKTTTTKYSKHTNLSLTDKTKTTTTEYSKQQRIIRTPKCLCLCDKHTTSSGKSVFKPSLEKPKKNKLKVTFNPNEYMATFNVNDCSNIFTQIPPPLKYELNETTYCSTINTSYINPNGSYLNDTPPEIGIEDWIKYELELCMLFANSDEDNNSIIINETMKV